MELSGVKQSEAFERACLVGMLEIKKKVTSATQDGAEQD
jgi:hypothetical protein